MNQTKSNSQKSGLKRTKNGWNPYSVVGFLIRAFPNRWESDGMKMNLPKDTAKPCSVWLRR
jgi:hypothetical protein